MAVTAFRFPGTHNSLSINCSFHFQGPDNQQRQTAGAPHPGVVQQWGSLQQCTGTAGTGWEHKPLLLTLREPQNPHSAYLNSETFLFPGPAPQLVLTKTREWTREAVLKHIL